MDNVNHTSLLTDRAANNKEAVENVGWIAGFGYDDSQLAVQRHPARDDLGKVSKDLPVIIIHQSSHLGVANSKALEQEQRFLAILRGGLCIYESPILLAAPEVPKRVPRSATSPITPKHNRTTCNI